MPDPNSSSSEVRPETIELQPLIEWVVAQHTEETKRCEAAREWPDEFHVRDGKRAGLFAVIQHLDPERARQIATDTARFLREGNPDA